MGFSERGAVVHRLAWRTANVSMIECRLSDFDFSRADVPPSRSDERTTFRETADFAASTVRRAIEPALL